MIVVRVEGGLGNQLFQAAFGIELAHRNKTELVFDLSCYADRPVHGYLLNQFCIKARSIRADEIRRIPTRYRDPNATFHSIRDAFIVGGLKRIKERPFGFNESYLNTHDNAYLVGYWQSDRFFPSVRNEIRKQFRLLHPLCDTTRRLRDRMLRTRSIAIHVRRGDYLNQSTTGAIRNLSIEYYRQCVMARLSQYPNCEVYVFSNDIPWCRDSLRFPCTTHYVDHNRNETAHQDLSLLSAADCIVMANSTFSWWGAYLAERPDHQVYGPLHWFHANTLNDTYLGCDNWMLVDDPQPRRMVA